MSSRPSSQSQSTPSLHRRFGALSLKQQPIGPVRSASAAARPTKHPRRDHGAAASSASTSLARRQHGLDRDLRHELTNRQQTPVGGVDAQLRRVQRYVELGADPNYVLPNDADVDQCNPNWYSNRYKEFDYLTPRTNAAEVWALTTPTNALNPMIAIALLKGGLDSRHRAEFGSNALFGMLMRWSRDDVEHAVEAMVTLWNAVAPLLYEGLDPNCVCTKLGSVGNYATRMMILKRGNLDYPAILAHLNHHSVNFGLGYDQLPNQHVWEALGWVYRNRAAPLERCTPLHVAVRNGIQPLVDALLPYVLADVDARTTTKDTALHIAAVRGDHSIFQSLVDAKANLNARNDHGETPLLVAAAHHQSSKIKRSELLAWIVTLHGVDPTAKDTDGHDVVYYARKAKLPNILNWLYEHGAVRPPRTAPSVSVVDVMDAQAALDHKFANADVIDVDP